MNDVDPRCAPFEEDLSALLDGELEGARLVWRELVDRFPASAAAERARERLAQP